MVMGGVRQSGQNAVSEITENNQEESRPMITITSLILTALVMAPLAGLGLAD
jgi:hypothetical protein